MIIYSLAAQSKDGLSIIHLQSINRNEGILEIISCYCIQHLRYFQARRVKKLHSSVDGDLSLAHHTRLQLHKGNINSIHHGPKYKPAHSKHDKLAKKKAKYYKKLLGENLK